MLLNAYLFFNGNAEEALQYYKDVLGGELHIMRFEGTPAAESVSKDWGSKVMHGSLQSPAGTLMASDSPRAAKDRTANEEDTFSLSFSTENESEAEAVFSKLSTGGNVTMPLQNTFWGAKFGMLSDKFGIKWMVNCQLAAAPASAPV